MNTDPQGYYARLGVDRHATAEDIRVAFRRHARRLHPDVAGTGDANAFIALKQAYDVLGDPAERQHYDRTAWPLRQCEPPQPDDPYDRPPPEPVREPPPPRGGRMARWAFVVALIAIALGVMEVSRWLGPITPSTQVVSIRPHAPAVPPRPLAADAREAGTRTPTGQTDYFTRHSPVPTVLWRLDPATRSFTPGRHLPAFTPVESLRILPDDGLAEVRLPGGETGFLALSALTAGDAAAARMEGCHADPGPPFPDPELLVYRLVGNAPLEVRNDSDYPAVVKLRSESGHIAASVFLPARRGTTLHLPPDVALRVDFAIGPLFSRRCAAFAGGMLARRFPDAADVAALTPLVVPPKAGTLDRLTEIPASVFNRD